jgi:hypothetical protein
MEKVDLLVSLFDGYMNFLLRSLAQLKPPRVSLLCDFGEDGREICVKFSMADTQTFHHCVVHRQCPDKHQIASWQNYPFYLHGCKSKVELPTMQIIPSLSSLLVVVVVVIVVWISRRINCIQLNITLRAKCKR